MDGLDWALLRHIVLLESNCGAEKYILIFFRLKIFDNFEELNISGLVETGGETIMLLSQKIGNISNGVFSNTSHNTGKVFEDTFLKL